MKILLLSCKTGGGHDAAGLAVKEALEARGHEAVFFDYLTLAGKRVSDTVGSLYVNTVKNMPHVFGLVYQVGMIASRIMRKSPVYYVNAKMGKYLKEYMEREQFDAVVMPHLYPAETITYMKRQGIELPLTVAVMTDYTCIPFWEETDCDYYVIPHGELAEQFIRRGIDGGRLLPFGIPVGKKFLKKADREKVRAFLHLPKEGAMFLLMGGSMGAGDLEKLTKELLAQKKQKDFITVICGNNKKMFQRMKKKYRQESGVILIGQTKQMDLYLKACDLIYTKPGGLTSTEAAASRTLMVHTAPIPGCETANRRFFVRRGMSIAPRTLERQVRKGRELLEKEEEQRKMREAQSRYVAGDAAEKIAAFVEKTVAE